MSSYQAALATCFPWIMKVPAHRIRLFNAIMLNAPGSFAITYDAPAGFVWLWMSNASKSNLERSARSLPEFAKPGKLE